MVVIYTHLTMILQVVLCNKSKGYYDTLRFILIIISLVELIHPCEYSDNKKTRDSIILVSNNLFNIHLQSYIYKTYS